MKEEWLGGGEELVAAVTIGVGGANFDLRLSSSYDNVLRARMQRRIVNCGEELL